MKHLDLFSGIGGFALAAERVWPDITHSFVEYDPFCQKVLRKHWPEAEIHGDIREFVADARSKEQRRVSGSERKEVSETGRDCFILTGGFPCQPFSQAGRRKGTADDRYLWPPMLECVSLFKPEWVIAENVRGLATWDDGVVLETVCSDLEKEGYEVQPLIIPAVAVGAPHRRDRIWFIAHRNDTGNGTSRSGTESNGQKNSGEREHAQHGIGRQDSASENPVSERRGRRGEDGRQVLDRESTETETEGPDSETWDDAPDRQGPRGKRRHENGFGRDETQRTERLPRRDTWNTPWPEVAARLCTVDDGLPSGLVRPRGWRNAALKAAGNAIVPQVAEEIMRAIARA